MVLFTNKVRGEVVNNVNWMLNRREELKLSQEELATRLQLVGLNVSRATVSHWETGKHYPPFHDVEFINKFSQVLEISVLELFERAGYTILKPSTKTAIKRAAFLLARMSPEKEEIALKILETLTPEIVHNVPVIGEKLRVSGDESIFE
jgi:transcriptional regulator with XRE-family HTH domain